MFNNVRQIIEQVSRDRCEEKTPTFEIMVNLITKKIVQCFYNISRKKRVLISTRFVIYNHPQKTERMNSGLFFKRTSRSGSLHDHFSRTFIRLNYRQFFIVTVHFINTFIAGCSSIRNIIYYNHHYGSSINYCAILLFLTIDPVNTIA